MTDVSPERFLSFERAYAVAPAGCGKTELIARAVSVGEGRFLILTHTHSGVRALKQRLRKLGVSPSKFRVDTIAGWSLRYAAAYPELSQLNALHPTGPQWAEVYPAAATLTESRHIRDVLRSSYSGVFVDEYQDCDQDQHSLVLALAQILPCRIVGDHLQAIFGWDNDLVDWDSQVPNEFSKVGVLSTPYRWKGKNDGLGQWLLNIRDPLEHGDSLELPAGLANWVELHSANQTRVCQRVAQAQRNSSVVAIGVRPQECQLFARQLGGQFEAMETMDCPDLRVFASRFQQEAGPDRVHSLIDFASRCITRVTEDFDRVRRYFRGARVRGPWPEQLEPVVARLVELARAEDLSPLPEAMTALANASSGSFFRRELWNALHRSVRIHLEDDCSLEEAAWRARDELRIMGRRTEQRTISRTLLIKGLEFDHAVVLNANALSRKNLYVAFTRPTLSLSVLAQSPMIDLRKLPAN